MASKGKLVLLVAAGVVSFLTVRYGIEQFQLKRAASMAETRMTQLQARAAARHPGQPPSEAVAREAATEIEGLVLGQADNRKKFLTAAASFVGFRLGNTRARVELCREQGVDIAAFVTAFERANAAEWARAQTAVDEFPADLETMYTTLKPQLVQAAEQDMRDVASQMGGTMKQACQLVADNADAMGSQTKFSVAQPAVHRVLMGAQ